MDLWVLPIADDRKPIPVVETSFDETAGQFSRDGRWVAYQSNESKPVQIYVRPFPEPGGPWQVIHGRREPAAMAARRERIVLCRGSTRRLMAVPIAVGADEQTLEAGTAVALFRTQPTTGANIPLRSKTSKAQYAVAPDGRFLLTMTVEATTAPPITVVLNWDASLKK